MKKKKKFLRAVSSNEVLLDVGTSTKWSGSSFHSITEWKIVVVLLMLNVYLCIRICHVFTNSLYSPV